MNFAWKFMVPMALVNILDAGLWHYMGPGPARWAVCSGLLLGSYLLLGRGLAEARRIERRTYRFAD
jgi:NADH-quinone oxidoreductase subunit H